MPAILKPVNGTPTRPSQGLVLKSAVFALVQSTCTSSAGQLQAVQNIEKYLDNLPEVEVVDCIDTDNIDDKKMKKLPAKILLVNSVLPLDLSIRIEQTNGKKDDFLFLQIVFPVQSNRFICLLCKDNDVNFSTKVEKVILFHYQTLHKLEVKTGTAKFSKDCTTLPSSSLETAMTLGWCSTAGY